MIAYWAEWIAGLIIGWFILAVVGALGIGAILRMFGGMKP